MGLDIILVAGILAASAAVIATMPRRSGASNKMKPQSIESFAPTANQEGSVVPWVRGQVRLNSTLLWYGRLRSKKIKVNAGGKGMGGSMTVGYKYYMDLWHALCQGPNAQLVAVYVNDRKLDNLGDLGTYTFNGGNDGTYPTAPGQYASPMTGIAHIYLNQYFLGENATTVPPFHWVVNVLSSAPLTYANEAKGCNAAAIIYDLLLEAGVPSGYIDIPSFQEAATYWHGKGYDLNVALSSQSQVKDHINTILQYVDGALYIDANNKFRLKAFRSTDVPVATITTKKFKEFKLQRRSWDDVFTDFRATFTDETADYTTRAMRARNPAVSALIGHDNQKTLDLTAFRDLDAASARLWDIMKRFSYPEAQVSCVVGIEYSAYNIGDVVSITHKDYGISNENYRIVSKSEEENDSNAVRLELTQDLDTMIDNNYQAGGGTLWQEEDLAPKTLHAQRVIELPYTERFGETPAFLCLAARKGQETGFHVVYSTDGNDYEAHETLSDFSQYGTLDEAYPADTDAIDDYRGILFTPYREDPIFEDLVRAKLFDSSRLAVIVNPSTGAHEILTFQTVTPEGANSFRLGGVIRGLMNTEPQAWSIGHHVWLTNVGDNIITGITAPSFYLKLLPYWGGLSVPVASASPISVSGAGRARIPWPVSRIKVVKSGSSNTVTVWPTERLYPGAGARSGSAQVDQDPPLYVGDFVWTINNWTSATVSPSYTWTITQAGGFTLMIRSRTNGIMSAQVSCTVGASNGTYYG